MSQENDDSVEELRALPREVAPDASLEQRTIAALRTRSLLRSPRPSWRLRPAGWLVAAGIVAMAFVSGFAAGRAGTEPARPEASFALMLYGEIGGDSATQMERAMEYGAWARASREGARVVGGEALGDRVGDVGVSGTADDLVGFFLVQARDREAAARLAADCPHVKYGGRVVVRQIQPT
jgi:YCII-related domain